MQKTIRQELELSASNGAMDCEGAIVIQPGDNITMKYSHNMNKKCRYWLRLVGEVGTNWRERCEMLQPTIWYQSLEDALDRKIRYAEEASLHLIGHGENFARNAWFKLSGNDIPRKSSELEFSIRARSENLVIEKEGFVGARLEIYYKKQGRHANDIFDSPDSEIKLAITKGSYEWRQFRCTVSNVENISAVVVCVSGIKFYGNVWIATPRLTAEDNVNLISPYTFVPHCARANWIGENLSRKEWPCFAIEINEKEIFRGEKFCNITRDPDIEISIPADAFKNGDDNIIKLTLIADYPTAPCYVLRRAEIISETAYDFEIVYVPEYARANQSVPVLIEINKSGIILESSLGEKRRFEQRGLYVWNFSAEELENGITITDNHLIEDIRVKRAVIKNRCDIYLGSGDAVYIHQDIESFGKYLKWYLREQIGNAITFRPVYRWSGSMQLSIPAWKFIVKLLNELKIFYILMADGRELQGKAVNPDNELLAGKYFKGRQSHEWDGAFYYWGSAGPWAGRFEPFALELFQRSKEPDGIHPGVRPIWKNNKFYPFYAPDETANMKIASENFVKRISSVKYLSTRHTGPSTLFRYFYQAGFDFVGAETMYGPEDIILSALRGASRAYRKDVYGAHLALQWSSVPVDTPEHSDRYFLSLACCYLHGVTEINAEEGLYRMESEYSREDRFGRACTEHRAAHTKFRRFVETHNRRGKIHVPIGILQGRYCGWKCFGRNAVWGQSYPSMQFGSPEESFDLLNLFYPRSKLDAIYRYPCEISPQGWYSGTPYSYVDIIPIEAPFEVLRAYKALIFLGWNTFDEQDFEKLLKYVEQGGILMLARPHVSINVERDMPAIIPDSLVLRKLLGDSLKCIERTEHCLGSGRVIFYGQQCYPSQTDIREEYLQDMRIISETIAKDESQRGWILGNNDVNFAAYDYGNIRVIYLLNICWWNVAKTVSATLLLNDKEFEINVPFGRILTVTIIDGRCAIIPKDESVDILEASFEGEELKFNFQADNDSGFTILFADNSYKAETNRFAPGNVVFNPYMS